MIYVFLAEGFEEMEALAPVDLIRRAGFEVRTVAVGSDNKVRGAHGIEVIADIKDVEFCDTQPNVVILPGGMPGTLNLGNNPTVLLALSRALSKGGLVGAICAAPSILGEAGYLEGKRVTCFPGFEDKLLGATVLSDEQVVRDGNIITAKGAGCAFEFALAIIEAISDKQTAQMIANSIFLK